MAFIFGEYQLHVLGITSSISCSNNSDLSCLGFYWTLVFRLKVQRTLMMTMINNHK